MFIRRSNTITCIIIIAMLITQRFITNLRKERRKSDGRGNVLLHVIYKLSQRSVYLIFFFLYSSVTISTTDKFAYMVLLFTSRFIVYLLSLIRLLSGVR